MLSDDVRMAAVVDSLSSCSRLPVPQLVKLLLEVSNPRSVRQLHGRYLELPWPVPATH
jgi:hypothetical protein